MISNSVPSGRQNPFDKVTKSIEFRGNAITELDKKRSAHNVAANVLSIERQHVISIIIIINYYYFGFWKDWYERKRREGYIIEN